MQETGKLSLEQVEAFLEGSEPVRFEARDQASLYEWVTRTLGEQGYSRLGRAGKGLVRRYIAKMTGRSRAQVTRLIGQFTKQGDVKLATAAYAKSLELDPTNDNAKHELEVLQSKPAPKPAKQR